MTPARLVSLILRSIRLDLLLAVTWIPYLVAVMQVLPLLPLATLYDSMVAMLYGTAILIAGFIPCGVTYLIVKFR